MKTEILSTTSAAARYSRFCLPSYRHLLTSTKLTSSVVALGYQIFQQPVGLILGEFCAHHHCVHIRSIFVASQHQKRGIAKELLKAFAHLAAQRGYVQLELEYSADNASIAALLQSSAWPAAEPGKIICRSDGEDRIEALMQDPWMTQYAQPDEFSFFPWRELPEIEFQQLTEEHLSQGYESGLAPQMHKFAEVNSVGLRYKGKVVGWMLTKSLGGTRILYENLFIQPQFRTLGRAAVLLSESIKWHYQRDGAALCGIWQTLLSNTPMLAFIKRRLGPYLSEWQETRSCCLSLQTPFSDNSTES